MRAWSGDQVTAALGLGSLADEPSFTAVGTDTRTLPDGALFVALVGERHDAHDHISEAALAGARGAVVSHIPAGAPAHLRYYVVADTLAALGQLARFARRRDAVHVCAVTGSNGKTTTKELLRAALGVRHVVHATRGNLNNLVGVPLTLLATAREARVAVIELGTNAPGEVARLAAIAEPDVAVVTTISPEHLEGLGDLEGVLREETAVLPWLPQDGSAVIPDEPAGLVERARALAPNVRVIGTSRRADEELRAERIELDTGGRVRFVWRGHSVALQLRGRHNAYNALLALAVGELWGGSAREMIEAIGEVVPTAMRSEIRHVGGMVVIADCYNANPGSVRAAIDLLAGMPQRGGRVAVLGSMLEMGPTSPAIHAEIAAAVAAAGLDLVVATGDFVTAFEPFVAALGDRLLRQPDPMGVVDALAERLRGDEVVLLKGSRGVALERLLPLFERNWGVLHPHGEASGPRASRKAGVRRDAPPSEHTPASHGTGESLQQPSDPKEG
jgi:UDP-N-acetylmuramoyl-tripeptide--D-alanyl-D-alanine ligase